MEFVRLLPFISWQQNAGNVLFHFCQLWAVSISHHFDADQITALIVINSLFNYKKTTTTTNKWTNKSLLVWTVYMWLQYMSSTTRRAFKLVHTTAYIFLFLTEVSLLNLANNMIFLAMFHVSPFPPKYHDNLMYIAFV